LAFGSVAYNQSKPSPILSAPETKSPIERLARAAVKNVAVHSPVKPSSTIDVVTPKMENLAENNAKLQAMAALLTGARTTEAEPNKPSASIDKLPMPEAGPELRTTRKAPVTKRVNSPISVRPVDEIAARGLSATLTDSSFSEVMNGWRGIKTCVKSITRRGFGGSGALKVAFKINADGTVKESNIANASNLIAERVGSCVTRQARKIKFPAYAGTEIVNKEAKFVF
jgi:hypothetical protein